MTLSKVIKAGRESEGVSEWNLTLSNWISEFAEESEEFKSIHVEGQAEKGAPYKDDFELLEAKVLSRNAQSAEWRAIRPENLSEKSELFIEANTPSGLLENDLAESEATKPSSVDEVVELDLSDADQREDDVIHEDASEDEAIDMGPTYEQGLEEGFAKGLEQGKSEVVTIAQDEANALRAKVEGVLSGLMSSKDSLLENVEDDLTRLAIHLAKQIVRGELSLSNQAIQQLVSTSLQNYTQSDNPTICLHPDDYATLVQLETSSLNDFEVIQDKNLSRGSIRVECGERRTEDLIEDRLSEISEKLLGSVEPNFLSPIDPLVTSKSDKSTADK